MLELIIQQTNSTVTTTVFQQTSGALWSDAILVMQVVTAITVAFFTVATFWEGAKNRRKRSLEKQLERLYNPLFEFLTPSWIHGHSRQKPLFVVDVRDEDLRTIRAAFQKYGHYLSHDEHENVTRLLSEAYGGEGRTSLKVSNIDAGLPPIALKRAVLKANLEALTAKRYPDEILWILIGVGVTLVGVYMILSVLGINVR